MPKREVSSDAIRKPVGVFSQATAIEATGRFVFISGMTARRADGTIAGVGDIAEQTRQVCENVKAAVEAAGGSMDDICRVDVYVRNMEHFDAIHKVRAQYFKPPLPASTMVEVTKMTSPDYLIEISAIAVAADGSAGLREATIHRPRDVLPGSPGLDEILIQSDKVRGAKNRSRASTRRCCGATRRPARRLR